MAAARPGVPPSRASRRASPARPRCPRSRRRWRPRPSCRGMPRRGHRPAPLASRLARAGSWDHPAVGCLLGRAWPGRRDGTPPGRHQPPATGIRCQVDQHPHLERAGHLRLEDEAQDRARASRVEAVRTEGNAARNRFRVERRSAAERGHANEVGGLCVEHDAAVNRRRSGRERERHDHRVPPGAAPARDAHGVSARTRCGSRRTRTADQGGHQRQRQRARAIRTNQVKAFSVRASNPRPRVPQSPELPMLPHAGYLRQGERNSGPRR